MGRKMSNQKQTPDYVRVCDEYFRAWGRKDYARMYENICPTYQAERTYNQFVKIFRSAAVLVEYELKQHKKDASCRAWVWVKMKVKQGKVEFDYSRKVVLLKEAAKLTPDPVRGEWGVSIITIPMHFQMRERARVR